NSYIKPCAKPGRGKFLCPGSGDIHSSASMISISMPREIGFGNWNINNNFTDPYPNFMRSMKWNTGVLLLMSFMLSFGLMGCSKNTPEARAERFLNSLYRMEYQDAKTM